MGALVDHLLLVVRAGHGRSVVHEPVDLPGVASDGMYDARAVDPSCEISPGGPRGAGGDGRRRADQIEAVSFS